MFSLFYGLWKYVFTLDEFRVLILGVDKAGKTVIAPYLSFPITKSWHFFMQTWFPMSILLKKYIKLSHEKVIGHSIPWPCFQLLFCLYWCSMWPHCIANTLPLIENAIARFLYLYWHVSRTGDLDFAGEAEINISQGGRTSAWSGRSHCWT